MARTCSECAKVQRTVMQRDGRTIQTLYNCHAGPPMAGKAFPDVQETDWCDQFATTLNPVTVTLNV